MTSCEIPETPAPRLPWDPADPHSFYDRRRRDGDVVWDETAQAWLVLGYEVARKVLGSNGWSSDPLTNPTTRAAVDPVTAQLIQRSMLFADGTCHRRLRGSVRDVFTPSFIAGLTDGIEAISAAVIRRPATLAPLNFMSEIALPLPLAIVGEWLDLDTESATLLRELSSVIIRMLGSLADPVEIQAGTAASAALMARFLPLAADRRAHPGDDLLSYIATDRALELEDVVMTAILIAVAGHETTANLLGAGLVRLLTPGRDGTRIADVVDPAHPALVNELLRLDGPVQTAARTATERHILAGTEISVGQTALVAVAAANRDPNVFECPDELWLDREGPPPLSFGYGAHYCVGSPLARLELDTALRELLSRRPALAGEVVWRDTTAVRGPSTVPIVFCAP
ncbi:MAG: cytochrome P450 [Actinomycetota bacterium]